MVFLIALMSFLTVTALIVFTASKLGEKERAVSERLARFETRSLSQAQRELEQSLFSRVVRPVLEGLSSVAAQVTPSARRDAIRRRRLQAGNPWGLQATEFVAVKIGLGLGLPLLLILLGPGRPSVSGSAGTSILILLVSGSFAAVLPEVMIKRRIAERQKNIAKNLPDVLDLLTVSVEAGLGFDGSLAKVVEKYDGAIAEEFRRVLQEMRMGKPRREALKDLGARSGVPDLMSFTVALVQADQLGVSIGKVLRVQSEEMRRRRRQRAEEAAMKAPIKMLFPLVLFVFPTLFIVLLGPAVIQVASMFLGMQ